MKIKIFDFDGTLFRSPEKPAAWKGGWWGKIISLSEPHVPNKTSILWWNEELIEESLKENSLNFIVTGRMPHFEKRVKELCGQTSIKIDGFFFCSDEITVNYKKKIFKSLIEQYQPEEFLVWEDNNIEEYREFLKEFTCKTFVKKVNLIDNLNI